MFNEVTLGDNLISLRATPSDSIDLVYLDPPYNSGRSYMHNDGDSIEVAYTDTWVWGPEAEASLGDAVTRYTSGGAKKAIDFLLATRHLLTGDMLAYLVMLTPRLIELHRVLKNTGSLYLHVDPSASHYSKVVLDLIFGVRNYRSEVIWRRTSAHNNAKRPGPVHDVILFYSKGDEYTWNPTHHEYSKEYKKEYDGHDAGRMWVKQSLSGHGVRGGDSGKAWKGFDPSKNGRHWSISKRLREEYALLTGDELTGSLLEQLDKLDASGFIIPPKKEGALPYHKNFIDPKGAPLQDVWVDIAPVGSRKNEYAHFEGQKPVALLSRILQASSNPGEIVLDPFLGSGTTAVAAESLGRKWLGFELNETTCKVAKNRLKSETSTVAPEGSVASKLFYEEQDSLRVQRELLDMVLSE